ncbi:hypothetical protein ACFSTI_11280 [Rhizorhabdus histidinilytica]
MKQQHRLRAGGPGRVGDQRNAARAAKGTNGQFPVRPGALIDRVVADHAHPHFVDTLKASGPTGEHRLCSNPAADVPIRSDQQGGASAR